MNEKVLFKLSYGLFVLTANADGKDNGCIINTVQQVTSSPLRISIALNKQNYTHTMIEKSGMFNVSILTEKTPFSIFERFGFSSGKDTDKFAGFDACKKSQNGLMYLTQYANAFISGKVVDSVDLGTHTLFIADVVDGEVLNNDLSITYEYYHKNTKPQNNGAKKSGYRCSICQYVYEGDTLPEGFVCPLCKHDASYFEKI